MMRFTARALNEIGVDLASIWVSLERNMQCGLGWCGHCQLGPLLLCRDGPVVNYLEASALMNERER
jgi:NAD(P)H-flavin reductase